MAKKSRKHFPRWRKENVGCMWGLISVCDFRQGHSTQRFLSDKKRGSSRNFGISYSRNNVDVPCNMEEKHADVDSVAPLSDTETEEDDRVNLGVSSFNTLRKKEMSRAHHSRKVFSSKIEWIKAELGIGANAEKNHKEATKNGEVGSDYNLKASPSLISQQSNYPNMSTMLSSDLDMGEFMLDYCSNGLQCERNQFEDKNKTGQYPSLVSDGDLNKSEHVDVSMAILQKAIVDLTEALLRENSSNSCKLVGNKEIHQPKNIVNSLELLNSNKELFLKLLQDPNSAIRKHIQDLKNIHFSEPSKPDHNQLLGELPGSKKFQKQSVHYFRKKDKLTVVDQSNESDNAKGLKRIVVLKPTHVRNQNLSNTIAPIASIRSHCGLKNKEDGDKFSSHFSLKEIRRFRYVIGASRKEKHPIVMDGILHKIPYGKQITNETETSCRRENTESDGEKRTNTKEIQKKKELSVASQIAGKSKRLSRNASPRVIYTEASFCDEVRKHFAEFLRIGIESESLPPIQVSKTLGRILSFPGYNYLSPRPSPAREKEADSLHDNTSLQLYHSKQKSNAEHLDLLRHRESFPSNEKSQEAKNEIMEIMEVEDKECIKIEEVSQPKAQSAFISNEDDIPSGTFKEQESSMLLEPEQAEVKFESSTPSTPIALGCAAIQERKDTDCALDNVGRPSPISVLEPLSFGDINIPTSMITQHATNAEKIQTQPRESQIDNSATASSSTNSEEDFTTCTDFDEALLFDELEISYSMFIHDPKLLFDSIDEVLTEIKERHFSCTPWVSFIKPIIWPIHKQEYFMKEACRKINWHLDVQFPSTLKQAVKKDLDRTIWIDLHFEAESVIDEIGDAILDHLFEETALELWD